MKNVKNENQQDPKAVFPAEVFVYDGISQWVSISPHADQDATVPLHKHTPDDIIGLSTVAVTGSYNDLLNRPNIPAPQVQSDWLSVGGSDYIKNKPTRLSQFTNDPGFVNLVQAKNAAPVQSLIAGANIVLSNDGIGNITIASTGDPGGPGEPTLVSVSGSAPIKVVDGTTNAVVSILPATDAAHGSVQLADAAAITAGTAGRVVDAAQLKAGDDLRVLKAGDTMTGSLVVPDGTAAAPAVKFDDATGIYQPAANSFAVSTAGVERIRVAPSGSVGIGHPGSLDYAVGIYNPTTGAGSQTALNIATQFSADSTNCYCINVSPRTESNKVGVYIGAWINRMSGSGTPNSSFGVQVDANFTKSPNNYGISSSIPEEVGKNNWNIRANGTAPNAFVGQCCFNTTGSQSSPAISFLGDEDTGIYRSGVNQLSVSTGGVERLRVNTAQVAISAGTAALPSIVGTGDADTGVYWPAANTFAISTAGVERLRVRADGNIGLGSAGVAHAGLLMQQTLNSADARASIFSQPKLTSSFNSDFSGLTSGVELQASASITNSFCFLARNATLASGAAVTNHYGVAVPASFTAGTNNYAILLGIPSGPNRWNIYASGTADNYLNGDCGIKTDEPTAALDINSDKIRLRTAKTPASASDTGNAGDICWDADYVYVCVSTNVWKRSPLETW